MKMIGIIGLMVLLLVGCDDRPGRQALEREVKAKEREIQSMKWRAESDRLKQQAERITEEAQKSRVESEALKRNLAEIPVLQKRLAEISDRKPQTGDEHLEKMEDLADLVQRIEATKKRIEAGGE